MAAEDLRRPLIIELVPHFDAGERWTSDNDMRPLSALGERQARAAAKALAADPIDALFSSPALRCYMSLSPLSDMLGIEIEEMAELAESDVGEGFASMAERGIGAIYGMRQAVGEGRVVACSHGDIIPAIIEVLAEANDLGAPALSRRGQWFTIHFDEEVTDIELHEIDPASWG
jgi:8-oxo-dGTP diphosphatase